MKQETVKSPTNCTSKTLIYALLGMLVLGNSGQLMAGNLGKSVGRAAVARILKQDLKHHAISPARPFSRPQTIYRYTTAVRSQKGVSHENTHQTLLVRRGVRQVPQQSMAFGKVAYGKPRDVIIRRAKYPQAAAHIEHSQKNGQPTVLHIDRAGAAERRVAAVGSVNPRRKPAPRFERDEYPPALTREGGSNANVRFISQHDNRGAGAAMGIQTRGLPNGAKIRVIVK